MNETKETNTKISKRLGLFLEAIPLSLRDFSKVTGISQATLSRIKNGSTGFRHDSISIIAAAFGVTDLNFQDENFAIPVRAKLIKGLKDYIKKQERDVDLNFLIQGRNTAHFLNLYIREGHMDNFQSMKDIRFGIKEWFDIELRGAEITNILNRRIKKGLIEQNPGEKKGTFRYKRVHT